MLAQNHKLLSIKRWVFIYQFILIVGIVMIITSTWLVVEFFDFKEYKTQHLNLAQKNNKLELKSEIEKLFYTIDFIRTNSDSDSLAREDILKVGSKNSFF